MDTPHTNTQTLLQPLRYTLGSGANLHSSTSNPHRHRLPDNRHTRGRQMSDPYAELREHFGEIEDVEVTSGRGAQGIKFGGKMFAMFHKGELLVKLPPVRVAEVIECGDGLAHDPGTGTPMKNRVLIPATNANLWIAYCEESRRHEAGEG